ncbi:MAG: SAM-dependent DNA methyltransferase, partial [candidate division WOR-3 bacterium]|nr:SAM-dependent DNA methyltransferase [candidate division WOR-3 bacterium]
GTADAVFSRFTIEYKRPGTLSANFDLATRSAVDQLHGYIRDLAVKEKRQGQRLAGVVFDGCYIIFCRYLAGKLTDSGPFAVNEQSLGRMLDWLAGLSSGPALTSENLNRDFSIDQPHTKEILAAFCSALDSGLADKDGIVTKLFEQWKLFFSESIDYSEAFGGRKLDPLKKWVAKAGIEVKSSEDAERFFFALHTYFALLVKLLAWLALSRHIGGRLTGPSFAQLVTADPETLRRRLKEMEEGGIFRAFGISNLLEGDFFSWYLYAWHDQMEAGVRGLLERLDRYDPSTLSIVPEETRDLFKKLYHYLLPREIRHNLGEYYTPDWLAQRLLNQLDNEYFTGDPNRVGPSLRKKLLALRFLDPACGSGTFPVLIIARMRELGLALMLNETELLDAILHNVVGIDLNPLAVLTARVNYVLAIAPLLEGHGEITIPIYLADSVRVPAAGTDIESGDGYLFPTAIGKFVVPIPLCEPAGRFDTFCDLLEEAVSAETETDVFIARVEKRLGLAGDPQNWYEHRRELLRTLYSRLLDLHKKGMNGLWARLLKNNFAPLTIGRFHFIVGNPPWVNWESLPDAYRDSIKPIWERYGLFPHGGMDTILGKGKKDISMLMTYVACDMLLVDKGRLGFIITQSLFKTSGAGQGFRRFEIPQGKAKPVPLRVVHVDDMVELNPFEGASNRTAVMVLEKGSRTRYPTPYTVWHKEKGARFTYDSTFEEVVSATKRSEFAATPVDDGDPASSWMTARSKALKALRQVLGQSAYQAREGSNTGGANAVFWVDVVKERPDGLVVIRNITAGAKVKVDEESKPVESDLLYPLLRGRDVERWLSSPSASIIVAQDPKTRRGIAIKEMQTRCPKTFAYLKLFEKMLRERAAFKRYFRPDRDPFYSMFNISDYTFAPWKVVWPEVANSLEVAVAGPAHKKTTVPDHTLIMIECESEDEAHYLCAALNSSPSRHVVQAYIVLHPDPHVMGRLRIPKIDPKDKVHKRLAELSMQAHELAKAPAGSEPSAVSRELQAVEVQVDLESAKLWDLTASDLAEIQRSLKELTE